MACIVVYEGTPPGSFSMPREYPFLILSRVTGSPVPAAATITYALGRGDDVEYGYLGEIPPGDIQVAGAGPYRFIACDDRTEAFQLGRA